MTTMLRTTLLFIFLFFISLPLFSQAVNQSYCVSDTSSLSPAGEVHLKILNNNFLRNNEYFNPYTVGITYFGSMLQPELSYSLSNRASLSVGWFLRYYFGKDKFNTSLPMVRLELEPRTGNRLIFGQLYGLLDHQLIEPIYSTDNYFDRNPEYGFQYKFALNRLMGDTWISWDHFILPGDDQKEEISAGLNASYLFTPDNSPYEIKGLIQGVIHHFGGQVDESNAPLETRLNLAPGIEFCTWNPQHHSTRLLLASYYIQAADQSSVVTIPYKKGFASYSYAQVGYKWASLLVSYFHGEYYFSPLGERLFQSVSDLNDWYIGDSRNVLGGKALFDFTIAKGLEAGVRFESYLDLDRRNFDFSYGINFKTNSQWLLKSLKKTR
jgi:hypothetical protein